MTPEEAEAHDELSTLMRGGIGASSPENFASQPRKPEDTERFTGRTSKRYKTMIRHIDGGITEDYWELSEEQVKRFVDDHGIAYANCHFEKGKPQYGLVNKKLWMRWDEVSAILLNTNLTSEEQAKALKNLSSENGSLRPTSSRRVNSPTGFFSLLSIVVTVVTLAVSVLVLSLCSVL